MKKFPKELVDILSANIDDNDISNFDARLPPHVDFICSAEERENCYQISIQLLLDYVDRTHFRALITTIMRQGFATPEQFEAYHKMRSCFKNMRYACMLFDSRHRYPRYLHKITILMGDFKDAMLTEQKDQITSWGRKLCRNALSFLSYRRFMRELADFRPDSDETFQRWIKRENAYIAHLLERDPLRGTKKELHGLRKVISRRVALNDALRTFRPSEERKATSAYLATLNDQLGDIHDELIKQKLDEGAGEEFEERLFTPPAFIAEHCKIFLAAQAN